MHQGTKPECIVERTDSEWPNSFTKRKTALHNASSSNTHRTNCCLRAPRPSSGIGTRHAWGCALPAHAKTHVQSGGCEHQCEGHPAAALQFTPSAPAKNNKECLHSFGVRPNHIARANCAEVLCNAHSVRTRTRPCNVCERRRNSSPFNPTEFRWIVVADM